MTQSNETTIEQMNVALAAFEGRKFYGHTIDKFGGDTHNALPPMKYHTSWDWLMPVLAKIKSIANAIDMPREFISRWKPIENELRNINITNTHYCVYKFIVWHNQQKQDNGTTENNAE